MAKLDLSGLSSIDGFVAAALVDSDSGLALATAGGGSVNLEVAAAGNSEVIKAKRRVAGALKLNDSIEDILITLGKQYHILRPSARKDGVFVYFVLDKQRANLAMARRKVLDVDKEMNF